MRKSGRLAALLLLAATWVVAAVAFESETFILDVPFGFQGPITLSSAEGSIIAFTKPHANAPTATLLQISILDVRSEVPVLPPQDLGLASERYLIQALGTIERLRSNFVSTKPTRVMLDGLPASRVTWVGETQNRRLHGVMYCVVVHGRVLQFHTQDLDTAPPNNFRDAESSIEHIRFK